MSETAWLLALAAVVAAPVIYGLVVRAKEVRSTRRPDIEDGTE
jgi:hypothetical protein